MKCLLIAATLLASTLAPAVAMAGSAPQACPRAGRLQQTAYRPAQPLLARVAATPPPCCRDGAGCAQYLSTRSLVHPGHQRQV